MLSLCKPELHFCFSEYKPRADFTAIRPYYRITQGISRNKCCKLIAFVCELITDKSEVPNCCCAIGLLI